MNEPITDRLPNDADLDPNGHVLLWSENAWDLVDPKYVEPGDAWQPCPAPYVAPSPDTSLAASIERLGIAVNDLSVNGVMCDDDLQRLEDAARQVADLRSKLEAFEAEGDSYDLIDYQNGFAMLRKQMGLPKDATFARMRTVYHEVLEHSCKHERDADRLRIQCDELKEKARKWDELNLRSIRDALGDAWTDLGQWASNAKRQRQQLEHNHPACPNLPGIEKTEQVRKSVQAVLKIVSALCAPPPEATHHPAEQDAERREWWLGNNWGSGLIAHDQQWSSHASVIHVREVLPTDPTPAEVEQLRRELFRWKECASIFEGHRDYWQRKAEALQAAAAGDDQVWYYQGDGTDMPESLTCRVVMEAEQLRVLLATAEAYKQLRRERDEWAERCERSASILSAWANHKGHEPGEDVFVSEGNLRYVAHILRGDQ